MDRRHYRKRRQDILATVKARDMQREFRAAMKPHADKLGS